jgi:hypothetical protein
MLRNKKLKDNPGMISSWLNRRRFKCPSAVFLNAQSVYEEVILHEMSRSGSPVAREFKKCYQQHGRNVQFVLLSSTREGVWSSGLSMSAAKNGVMCLGFNLYGVALSKAYRKFARAKLPVDSVDALLNESVLVSTARKTLTVVSDSMSAYFQGVQGGTVIAKGGATFDELANILSRIDPLEQRYLAVHGGANDAKRSFAFQEWSWSVLEPELMRFVDANVDVLLSGPIPHPGAPGVHEHSAWMRDQLRGSPIRYIDWTTFSNPFIGDDGRHVSRYFCFEDDFHFSHRGCYKLWEEWCRYFTPLRQLKFKLSKKPYQQYQIRGGVYFAL